MGVYDVYPRCQWKRHLTQYGQIVYIFYSQSSTMPPRNASRGSLSVATVCLSTENLWSALGSVTTILTQCASVIWQDEIHDESDFDYEGNTVNIEGTWLMVCMTTWVMFGATTCEMLSVPHNAWSCPAWRWWRDSMKCPTIAPISIHKYACKVPKWWMQTWYTVQGQFDQKQQKPISPL